LEDVRSIGAVDDEVRPGALLQAGDVVVLDHVLPWCVKLELDHRCPTGRDKRRLDVADRLGGAFLPYAVKTLADDVETRVKIRTTDAEEDAYDVADTGT
jgi:hypothetical protein